ncbi:MAG: hypothetical protein A2X84_02320 [Desulfuromonadaceae bacterium GWC2_58_13]|nr:MAG: hypothetical protein A2X84_02320 [Desulfuromonadaceae bacterium GWC2_58_13]
MFRRLFFAVVLILLSTNGAWALSLGANITRFDDVGTGTGWYGAQEDNEVEPNNVQAQGWDLEGFFLKGTTLAMVGGYDFINGKEGLTSGDIFIDVDGLFSYGTENATSGGSASTPVVNNTFGYDYVLDMDFASRTYSVIRLDSSASVVQTELVYYSQNAESNPWLYYSGGTLLDTLTMEYLTGLSDTETGLTGGLHNAAFLDLSFLGHGTGFTAHFTMECGNDNLMGRGVTPAPEPGTLILLGAGLVGLLAWRRSRH